MKLSDIPLQCRTCWNLDIEVPAVAKFKEDVLKEGKRVDHIAWVPMTYINIMPKKFDGVMIQQNRFTNNSGYFTKKHVDILSVGEVTRLCCYCSTSIISQLYKKNKYGNPLIIETPYKPMDNKKQNCKYFSRVGNEEGFDIFRK